MTHSSSLMRCSFVRSKKMSSPFYTKRRSSGWEMLVAMAASTTRRARFIRAIVQVVKPKIGDRIYDGAVGSKPASGNITDGVYNVHDYDQEKRDALIRWEQHLLRIVTAILIPNLTASFRHNCTEPARQVCFREPNSGIGCQTCWTQCEELLSRSSYGAWRLLPRRRDRS